MVRPPSAPAIAAAALLLGTAAAVALAWRAQGPLRDRPGITSPASPPWVAAATACLERAGAPAFRVGGRLRGATTYQPLVVGAWPIEVREAAPILVAGPGDLPDRCRPGVLCAAGEVRVARCPP